MTINRTEAGEPIEAAGHVALNGADASTPTLAELYKVAGKIGRDTAPRGPRATNADCVALREAVDAYCASIGAATSDVDTYGNSHGPHVWHTFEMADGGYPGGIWAGSMTEAVVHFLAWQPEHRIRAGWVDPDCTRMHELKAVAHAAELRRRAEERAAAKRAAAMSSGLLGLLGEWDKEIG